MEIRDERGRECGTEVGINDCGGGHYQIKYTPKDQGRWKASVKVNREHVDKSPYTVAVKPFPFHRVSSSEGSKDQGSALAMFNRPFGLAVNAGYVTVTGNSIIL